MSHGSRPHFWSAPRSQPKSNSGICVFRTRVVRYARRSRRVTRYVETTSASLFRHPIDANLCLGLQSRIPHQSVVDAVFASHPIVLTHNLIAPWIRTGTGVDWRGGERGWLLGWRGLGLGSWRFGLGSWRFGFSLGLGKGTSNFIDIESISIFYY